MTWLAVIIAMLVILVAYWYVQHMKAMKHLKRFKGPTPLPLIGDFLHYTSSDEMLMSYLKLHQKHGPLFVSQIEFDPVLLSITDIKFLEYLLGSTKLLDKSSDYQYFHRWLGTGLLTSTGDKWRKHRKILTPAFHFKILEQFTDLFDHYSNILVEKLNPEVGKKSTDIYPYITLCSLDIICGTSMGTEVKAQDDSDSEYVHSVKYMCKLIVKRMTSFKVLDMFYVFTKAYQLETKAVKILHDYTYSVIRSRTKELENKTYLVQNNDEDFRPKKKTMLDTLITYKKQNGMITDEHIREEVDTFMFEGHDTVASAMTFVLYCLATHPDIQDKVIQELRYIFADDFKKPATHQDLQAMKYLEMVIKETLRLYPSVPIYGRRVSEDIEYDGGILPKGLTLEINAFCLHRDPKHWPDPERFDPERFSTEKQSKRSLYAYIPFSAGSRNCIGQKFAMLEMKEVVSKILKNYELLPSEPQHKVVLVCEAVLKSSTGVHIQFKDRKL